MSGKFKNKYRIESNRCEYIDYSSPGYYFITICVEQRIPKLGRIIEGGMQLSPMGEIVTAEFLKMEGYNSRLLLDEWIVMPDHIHCILKIERIGFNNGVAFVDSRNEEEVHEFPLNTTNENKFYVPPIHPLFKNETNNDIKQYRAARRKMLIPKILGKFKMQTSKKINILCNSPGKRNWQPDYHDRIIRTKDEYFKVKNYIIRNPEKWYEEKSRKG